MDAKPDVLQKIDRLTQRFNETVPLTDAEQKRLYQTFSRQVSARMIDDGVSRGEAAGLSGFYKSDEGEFRKQLQDTNQDLGWQCDTVDNFLSHHLTTGDVVPPYFPRRIAILLRKAGERERERGFLEAYCRHFGTAGWFGDRLRKLGSR